MDAVNLGWKLASGRDELLDTYNAERHPVGAAVLHNTRAQAALLRPGPHTDALRDIVSDLMDVPRYADGSRGRLADLTRAGGLVQIGPPEIVSTGREDLAAALIRPDGVVAWAAAPDDSYEMLAVARGTWA